MKKLKIILKIIAVVCLAIFICAEILSLTKSFKPLDMYLLFFMAVSFYEIFFDKSLSIKIMASVVWFYLFIRFFNIDGDDSYIENIIFTISILFINIGMYANLINIKKEK